MLTRLSDLTVLADKLDPGVKPNWTFFPFMGFLRNVGGGTITATLVVSVIVLVIAIGLLVIGKSSGSNKLSDKSASVLLWVIGGAALIGSASGLIAWGANLDLGF
ncbi:hypothetical protein [Sanguibacter massiliensis]|uniref:hypothetical protein n=1 Tax=Sanguibacter massiliensis TaxID=1973217 RepID=UPI000C83ED65|nr:hypothetical protein [Sanguibacter massiliensis]